MNMRRVLVSAYACNPTSSVKLHPGEDIKGWRFVVQISRFHKVWVITHAYNRPGIEKALREKALPGVTFVFIDLPSWFRLLYKIEFGQRIYYYIWQIKALQVAKKYNKEIRFDLSHHLSFGNDWIPSFIGALLPVPFIWGPLGGGQRTPELLLSEYSLYGRFAEKMRDLAQFIGRNDFFRRLCMKKAIAILVCNQETKNKVPNRYQSKVYWFPLNGIFQEDLVGKANRENKGTSFKVISAGRLHRLKGFSLGVKAFAAFCSKYTDVELVIIGKGPESKRLKKEIVKLKLSDKTSIIPWLSRKDLLAEFQKSDVFLFPSFRDGGGAVVVEAMAAALPAICLDTGGPAFHINPEWGIKIEPFSPEYVQKRIAESLEILYSNRSLCKKMGERAFLRAKEFYLSDRLGERLNQIYLKVSF